MLIKVMKKLQSCIYLVFFTEIKWMIMKVLIKKFWKLKKIIQIQKRYYLKKHEC